MAYVKLCKISEISPGRGKAFSVNGKIIAVFHSGNRFYAVQNACPHMGASLAEGELDDNVITCLAHGWQFDLETGKHLMLPVKLERYNTKIEGDNLFIDI